MTEQLFDLPPAIRGRKTSPVDLIFTATPKHLSSFIAKDAGWLVGIRSTEWAKVEAERDRWSWMLDTISFVDNEFKAYNHAEHLAAVRAIMPKYATVRDYLTEDQATAAGIDYYPLEQIIDWACELAEFADNVIVIPKADVIDQISEDFVLGYSVPSSYGATPLPIERFAHRRIHLLGGSWQSQRTYLSTIGDAIVSADLNHPWKASRFGGVIMGDGTTKDLVKDLGMYPRNSSMSALALSLGNIANAVIDISHMRDVTGGADGVA